MERASAVSPSSEFRQHGIILLPAMAGIMFCAIHGYTLGVMIGPLEQEFGWARAQISTGPLIVSLIALVVAPLVGMAVDRFGSRKIGLVGPILFAGAIALLATATPDLRMWWALWVLMGVTSMFVIPTVWTAAINASFERHRGIALAIALCGTGIAAAVYPTLANALVERLGWRGAYVGLAAISLAIVLPLVFLFFRGPQDRKRNEGTDSTESPKLRGIALSAGLRSPSFIKLAAAATVFSVAICALTANAVPVLLGEGLNRTSAAATAGLIGIGSIAGRLGGGLLLDRFNAGIVAACSVLTPLITVAILLSTQESAFASGIAFLVMGLSVGTELDACAYLAARHFGMRSFGGLFGAVNGLLLFGAGAAPLLANHIYDVTRSYDLVLWAIIPACIVTALLFLTLGPYPQFDEAGERIPAGGAVPEPA
jgi:MFS family permease